MWYRRNADPRLRELERRYKETGSLEDREKYIRERLRTGLAGLQEQIVEILDSHVGTVSYSRINIHSSTQQFHSLLNRYGENPDYQVINDFLAFEVKKNILNEDVTPDELETVYDDIAKKCILLAWPVILDDLYLPFSGDEGYNTRRSVEYFLTADEAGDFNFKSIKLHEDIDRIFELSNLEKIYERELDEYEIEEANTYRTRLHQELNRGRLQRKLYVINPNLLKITGDIKHRIPSGGKLLANHMGRYETFLHVVLVEIPPGSYPESPWYVTWRYNIQLGGFSTGHYFRVNEYDGAVEDYLRRVVRID